MSVAIEENDAIVIKEKFANMKSRKRPFALLVKTKLRKSILDQRECLETDKHQCIHILRPSVQIVEVPYYISKSVLANPEGAAAALIVFCNTDLEKKEISAHDEVFRKMGS